MDFSNYGPKAHLGAPKSGQEASYQNRKGMQTMNAGGCITIQYTGILTTEREKTEINEGDETVFGSIDQNRQLNSGEKMQLGKDNVDQKCLWSY